MAPKGSHHSLGIRPIWVGGPGRRRLGRGAGHRITGLPRGKQDRRAKPPRLTMPSGQTVSRPTIALAMCQKGETPRAQVSHCTQGNSPLTIGNYVRAVTRVDLWLVAVRRPTLRATSRWRPQRR